MSWRFAVAVVFMSLTGSGLASGSMTPFNQLGEAMSGEGPEVLMSNTRRIAKCSSAMKTL